VFAAVHRDSELGKAFAIIGLTGPRPVARHHRSDGSHPDPGSQGATMSVSSSSQAALK
jgi:hypothetical protein